MLENPTFLSFYKLLFLTELIVAESIFAYKLRRRNYFLLCLFIVLIVLYLIAFLLPSISNPFYIAFIFLFLFTLSCVGLKICFKESKLNVLFVGIAGYTTQHISYAIKTLLINLLSIGDLINYFAPNSLYLNQVLGSFKGINWIEAVVYIFTYFNVYFVVFNTLGHMIKKNENLEIQNNIFVLLSTILIISDVLFNMLSVFYSEARSVSSYIELGYSIIICVLSFSLQFSQLNKKKVERDLETTKIMYSERLKQYELSKENIDIINSKCHDLKHQIHQIGKNQYIDKNELKEIEKALDIYDSKTITGNEALNIILTEKSLLCKKYKINLSMLIDGELLNFIDDRDIFTLFGNALDNAIEALQKVDEDKRDITIIVKKKKMMTTIHIENYFDGEIRSEDGKILSIKEEDKAFHGYGISSMKRIVDDYGGTFSVDIKDHSFAINIIFMH